MSSIKSSMVKRDIVSQQDIENWANQLIRSWISRIQMLDIPDTGFLIRTFQHRIIWEARGSDGKEQYLHRVQFLFHFYGKMVDYGLGAGVDIKDRFEHGRNAEDMKRKRQQWIRDPWIEARKSLVALIAANGAQYSKAMLRDRYEGGAETHFKTREI